MTIDEAIKYLKEIDEKYQTEEDKNYYLVHGLTDVLNCMKDEDFEVLKEKIWENFSNCGKQYLSFLDYLHLVSNEDILSMDDEGNTSKQTVNHKEIHNIIDFYDEYDENLIRYIKGHLFLEYIMNTILEKSINTVIEKLTFNDKIYLLYKNHLINKKEKDLLISINRLRNRIAHVLEFQFSFDELFNIVKASAECGVDYSDYTIYMNRKLSKEWYGIGGIINELFPNLFCHLLYKNEKYFSDTEINKYMM